MNTDSSAATKKKLTAETQRTRRFRPWERTHPACRGVGHPGHAGSVRSQGRKFLAACKGFFFALLALFAASRLILGWTFAAKARSPRRRREGLWFGCGYAALRSSVVS